MKKLHNLEDASERCVGPREIGGAEHLQAEVQRWFRDGGPGGDAVVHGRLVPQRLILLQIDDAETQRVLCECVMARVIQHLRQHDFELGVAQAGPQMSV